VVSLTEWYASPARQTANVLLDAAGRAKVADFGTVREAVEENSEQTHAVTQNGRCAVRLLPHRLRSSNCPCCSCL
jgi:hypothetical protein